MMKLFIVVLVGALICLGMAGVTESQCVPGPDGTCAVHAGTRVPMRPPSRPPFPLIKRPLIPVRTAIKHIVCPRPQVNVQTPPAQVIIQTPPAESQVEEFIDVPEVIEEPDAKGATPTGTLLCLIGAILMAGVLFYGVGKN